ncbi:MAG: phosphate-starvation-inducible PsiE family protein [Cocleimonas sp.]|nr:phosphate-starvation-inducible PsiE family protein [Cocleimonas sp.]
MKNIGFYLEKLGKNIEKVGDGAVEVFHLVGLFMIGGTVAWTAIHEYLIIMEKPFASLSDILLLFIYLELGAMVGIFFKTKRLPVIFLLFISITALTRYLAVDLKTMGNERAIMVVLAILLLTISVLILRFSEVKFGDGTERANPHQRKKEG